MNIYIGDKVENLDLNLENIELSDDVFNFNKLIFFPNQ